MKLTQIKDNSKKKPRYVAHFTCILKHVEKNNMKTLKDVEKYYNIAVKRAHSIGGRKYHVRGRNIVFTTNNPPDVLKMYIDGKKNWVVDARHFKRNYTKEENEAYLKWKDINNKKI